MCTYYSVHNKYGIATAYQRWLERILIKKNVTEEPNLLTKQRGRQALTPVLIFGEAVLMGQCPSARMNPQANRHRFAHSSKYQQDSSTSISNKTPWKNIYSEYVTEEPNLLTKQRGQQALTLVLLFGKAVWKGMCPSTIERIKAQANIHRFAHSPKS